MIPSLVSNPNSNPTSSKQLILQDILIYTYIYVLCTFYVVFLPAALHGFYSAFGKWPCVSQKALKNEMFYYCQITLVQNKHFTSERTCSFQPNIFLICKLIETSFLFSVRELNDHTFYDLSVFLLWTCRTPPPPLPPLCCSLPYFMTNSWIVEPVS